MHYKVVQLEQVAVYGEGFVRNGREIDVAGLCLPPRNWERHVINLFVYFLSRHNDLLSMALSEVQSTASKNSSGRNLVLTGRQVEGSEYS